MIEVLEKTAGELTLEELENLLNNKKEEANVQANQKRKAYEDTKNSVIIDLCQKALGLNAALKAFKKQAFEDLGALYELLQEYSKRHSDGKGNFTVETQDGTYKIEFSRQNLGFFDERADQGERHIIDFVNSQFSGDPTTKKLITSLLERSKDKLDIKLVQKLYAMEADYQDNNWKEGIKLLKESWTPSNTKDYIRFFRKVNTAWVSIDINFSSIKWEALA